MNRRQKKLADLLFSLIEDDSRSSGSIVAQILITGSCNIQNKRNETLLMHSIYHNRADIAYNLIMNGADVNIRDKNGNTALHYAVASGIAEETLIPLIRLLVDKGAETDCKNRHKKTPLMTAKELNRFDIIGLLHEAEE